jgi:hypothetical protein
MTSLSQLLTNVHTTRDKVVASIAAVEQQHNKITARGWNPKTPKKLYKLYKEAKELTYKEMDALNAAINTVNSQRNGIEIERHINR